MAGRKKGTQKTGGRNKGVPNKTTKEARELLESILFGQLEDIKKAFASLKSEPSKYIDAYSKMFGYVLPKKTDVTSDDKPLQANLNITVDNSETAETLKRLRDELANRG
jgi:hypothetical protein